MFGWPAVIAQLVLSLPAPQGSMVDEELLAEAEAAFRHGCNAPATKAGKAFADAADAFGVLRKRGHHNADLCKNEARAALLAGRLPQAIRAYREALQLAPADTEARAELDFARDQVRYPSGRPLRPGHEGMASWLGRVNANVLLTLAAVAWALAWPATSRWFILRRARWAWAGVALFGLALLAGTVCAVREQAAATEAAFPVVVVAREGCPLRTGNGLSYPEHQTLPRLPAGIEGRRRYRRGDWFQIELADGTIGWVRKADVLTDKP